jgi:hypothetical protein
VRWFPELRGLSRRARRALLLAGLLLGLVAEWLALPGQSLSQAGGDLAAGLALIGCGLAAWSARPESRVGALLTLTGFAWFLGTFARSDIAAVAALGAAVLTFHRGVLFHAIVTYPGGRLSGGWLTVAVVALGYAYGGNPSVGSNSTSTATDLQEYRFSAAARRVARHPLAHLFGSVMSRVRPRHPDQPRLLCLVTDVLDRRDRSGARRLGVRTAVHGWSGPSATGRIPANLRTA